MDEITFPSRILRKFVQILAEDIGLESFSAMLLKSESPAGWSAPTQFKTLDDAQSAQAYAYLQSALRTFYGRGARGILLRVGSRLWHDVLEDSTFRLKAQAALIRVLPKSMRRKLILDLLARTLSAVPGNITVHTLDLDLLVVDQTSPATLHQSENSPICFVTLGMIRECLYWADGQEHDIEERACRALGAHQCEFKIVIGG
jgi:predicted hydrocarbon binding protein